MWDGKIDLGHIQEDVAELSITRCRERLHVCRVWEREGDSTAFRWWTWELSARGGVEGLTVEEAQMIFERFWRECKLWRDADTCCETVGHKTNEVVNLQGKEYTVGGLWEILMCCLLRRLTSRYTICSRNCKQFLNRGQFVKRKEFFEAAKFLFLRRALWSWEEAFSFPSFSHPMVLKSPGYCWKVAFAWMFCLCNCIDKIFKQSIVPWCLWVVETSWMYFCIVK